VAISTDLRKRALARYEEGGWPLEDVALEFGVSVPSLTRWRRLLRETGSLEPRGHAGGRRSKVSDEKALRDLLEAEPDLTLDELATKYGEATSNAVSSSSISRALSRIGITRKK